MIRIHIPDNNYNERKYIIDVVFGEFFGLQYNIESDPIDYYEIELVSGKKLIIEDHFFSKYKNSLEYLKAKNIPKTIKYYAHPFLPENDIPVLFGKGNIDVLRDKVICHIDIFASSFFMLTRWEEYTLSGTDTHNRFPAANSLAKIHNFLSRPVVDEYTKLLWNMLKHLGIKHQRIKRDFKILPTHDIDALFKYKNAIHAVKQSGHILLKGKKPLKAMSNISKYFSVASGIAKDPFDNFEKLMDYSEKWGVSSHFFFMINGKSMFDAKYDIHSQRLFKIMKNILNRGHKIGIHPSYNSYNDLQIFSKEVQEFENILGTKVEFGRQHYLRFDVPLTWQIWEECNLKWDSSMGYASFEGFRCGTCHEFPVFNIISRQKLKLREKPLIIMEGSFVEYQKNISPEDMKVKIKDLITKVKRYKGTFVILWHNSSFNSDPWIDYQDIYWNLDSLL